MKNIAYIRKISPDSVIIIGKNKFRSEISINLDLFSKMDWHTFRPLLEDIDDFIYNEFDPIIENQIFNFEQLLKSVGIQNYGGTDTKNK